MSAVSSLNVWASQPITRKDSILQNINSIEQMHFILRFRYVPAVFILGM